MSGAKKNLSSSARPACLAAGDNPARSGRRQFCCASMCATRAATAAGTGAARLKRSPLQEYERLGVQPGIARVVGNQHHRVQRDQREEQRVNGEHGVDPEHAELPLALQHAAVKTAQRRR